MERFKVLGVGFPFISTDTIAGSWDPEHGTLIPTYPIDPYSQHELLTKG